MNPLRETISWLKTKVQEDFFPFLQVCFADPITVKQKQLITILELVQMENHVKTPELQWMGRKLVDRYAIARAFVAKAVYRFPTTRALMEGLTTMPNLRSICGFSGNGFRTVKKVRRENGKLIVERVRESTLPSEATFSRAFAQFAASELGARTLDAMVALHLSDQLIGHVSRDATAIHGNEKPVKMKKEKAQEPKKQGRPKKGAVRKKEEKRLDRQVKQTAAAAIGELPTACTVGSKKNAQGYKETWIGYKLHVDTNDNGFPLSVVLTSASLHDSQVAIPMMKMTSEKVTYLYDLMDSAYDAKQIHQMSRTLGHVPIIDPNPRRGRPIPLAPAEAKRYNERTAAERTNSRLKCDFGGETVMVRGAGKVKLHLMFGIVALFADQLMKMAT
jgi:hypothetical protein